MTHLPADFYLKPLLVELGVKFETVTMDPDEPYLAASMAICGVEAPKATQYVYRPQPSARFLGDNETIETIVAQEVRGYFHARSPWKRNGQTLDLVLHFRDDGRTLADHLATIDCPKCHVILDQLMEHHGVTTELAVDHSTMSGLAIHQGIVDEGLAMLPDDVDYPDDEGAP